MNLKATSNGMKASGPGWFNSERIAFKYRLRKLNPIWLALVSRSISIIDLIGRHDWLRRKAGSEYGRTQLRTNYWFKYILKQLKSSEKFYTITSPDITMNSRILLKDLLSASLAKGMEVIVGDEVLNIDELDEKVMVQTADNCYRSENVVICSPDVIANKYNLPISTGFAPMAVVENVPEDEVSFVELDYNVKNCINLLKKPNGAGQVGGITVDKENEIKPYLEHIINQHRKRNPDLKILDTYVGTKKELLSKGQNRNYLYHINQNSGRIWSVVLGKFTLAFSMAPEFHRRVFNKNPNRYVDDVRSEAGNEIISKTTWQEIVIESKNKG